MANKGKRMLFEEDYEYLQEVIDTYPDPTDIGGSSYTAGDYINISNLNTISVMIRTNTDTGGVLVNQDEQGFLTIAGDTNTLAYKNDLATVATTGSYTDLSNLPTIPTATSDLNNDSGFITSSDIPTNYVTTDTTQDITAAKTFKASNKTNMVSSDGIYASSTYGAYINAKAGLIEIKNNSGRITTIKPDTFTSYVETGDTYDITLDNNGTTSTYSFAQGKSGTVATTDDTTKYRHLITIQSAASNTTHFRILLSIFNSSSTQMTWPDVCTYLESLWHQGDNELGQLPVNGYYYTSATAYPVWACYKASSNDYFRINIIGASYSGTWSSSTNWYKYYDEVLPM